MLEIAVVLFRRCAFLVLASLELGCGSDPPPAAPTDEDTGPTEDTSAPETEDTRPYDGNSDGPCTTRVFTPIDTLSALGANNSSASPSFKGTANGNAAAGSVSKLPFRGLLYAGAKTRAYAHFVGWFGSTGHVDVGYKSDDATQIKRQVDDMLARGIDGAIVDWLGSTSTTVDATTKLMLAEADKRGGKFEVAIMEDGKSLSGCTDCTTKLLTDLAYAYDNFEKSASYMKIGTRPVVFFTGLESFSIDWSQVRSKVSGDPIFVQKDEGAFSDASYQGAYCWVTPGKDGSNWGKSYLDSFYGKAQAAPSAYAFGCTYKGYDDGARKMDQRCGGSFLDGIAAISARYSASKPLEAVQLVTWNDYENGTALEVGIDNCGVTAAVKGDTLTWTVARDDATIDHFELYVSTDGENVMPLVKDIPATTFSASLPAQGMSAGTYKFHVRALGKAMFRNTISNAVEWTTAGNCVGKD